MNLDELPNWLTAVLGALGLGGAGLVVKAYKGSRVIKEDRRIDHSADFAENAYKKIIAQLELEIARLQKELHDQRDHSARLEIDLNKSVESIRNMAISYRGIDPRKTDIGVHL